MKKRKAETWKFIVGPLVVGQWFNNIGLSEKIPVYHVIIAMTFLAWLGHKTLVEMRTIRPRKPERYPRFLLWSVPFFAWAILTSLAFGNARALAARGSSILIGLLLAVILVDQIREPYQLSWAAKWFSLSGLVYTVPFTALGTLWGKAVWIDLRGIAVTDARRYFEEFRAGSVIKDPNIMAMMLIGPFFYFLFGAIAPRLFRRKSRKALWLLSAALMIAIIASTYSRSAMLTVLFVAACLAVFLSRGNRRRIVARFVLVGIVLIAMAPSSIKSRLSSLTYAFSARAGLSYGMRDTASIEARKEELAMAAKLVKASPWVGHGLGNYLNASGELLDYPFFAHNNYVEIAAETGIVGFVFFGFWAVSVFLTLGRLTRCLSTKREDHIPLVLIVGGLIGFFFEGLFINFFHQKSFWLLIGMIGAVERSGSIRTSLGILKAAAARRRSRSAIGPARPEESHLPV